LPDCIIDTTPVWATVVEEYQFDHANQAILDIKNRRIK
jgi:hypothetical protein